MLDEEEGHNGMQEINEEDEDSREGELPSENDDLDHHTTFDPRIGNRDTLHPKY